MRISDWSSTCALPISDRYPETAERFIEKDHYDGPSYFGLTYAVDPRWSIYASWADVYEPNYEIVAANDRSLAPITGENYETGIKFRAGDGRFNASLSLYHVSQSNYANFVRSEEHTSELQSLMRISYAV